MALTTLEVFLVVLAFMGFWVIRREAIAAAEEAAREEVNVRLNTDGSGKPERAGVRSDGASPQMPSADDKEEAEDL